MSNPEKKAQTIARLLALAEHPNTTEAERVHAAARAADLMTRHGIDEAHARAAAGHGPEPVQTFPYAVSGTDGHGKARAALVYRVAEALGCKAAVTLARPPAPCMTAIVGAAPDLATLQRLLPLIMVQAERAAADQARTATHDRGYLSSFLVGYGTGVADKIHARRATLAHESHRAALVLKDRADRVSAAFDALFGNSVTDVPTGYTAIGLIAGRDAGHHADLNDAGLSTPDHPALPEQ